MDKDQIITLKFTINECTIYCNINIFCNFLPTRLLPSRCPINSSFLARLNFSPSDRSRLRTCDITSRDSGLIGHNRGLNQIVFHYTKNNTTVCTSSTGALWPGAAARSPITSVCIMDLSEVINRPCSYSCFLVSLFLAPQMDYGPLCNM